MRHGEKVALVYAAANRDPAHFPNPDAFLPERDEAAHLSFGWGVHRCVGSFLAQTELRLLARTLVELCELTLTDAETGPLTGGHHMGMRWLDIQAQRRPSRVTGSTGTGRHTAGTTEDRGSQDTVVSS